MKSSKTSKIGSSGRLIFYGSGYQQFWTCIFKSHSRPNMRRVRLSFDPRARRVADTNSGWWTTPPSLSNIRWKWSTSLRKTATSQHKQTCFVQGCGLTYKNCRQLQHELFGRRHNTAQPHGLSAIAELLVAVMLVTDYIKERRVV